MIRSHAQALLAVGLATLGRPAEAVLPGVAALRSAVAAGRVDEAMRLRTVLAACARALGDPVAGAEILQPAVAGPTTADLSPSIAAKALAELAACLSHLAGRDDVEDALTEADRLLAADESLPTARRRLERAAVCAHTAAYHRRHGDTESAADAAHEGMSLLRPAASPDLDLSACHSALVYELTLALLDDGALDEATTACAPLLTAPLRAAAAPQVARLRLAVATRIHLPAGRAEQGRTLLLDTIDTAQRHDLDTILADAWTFLAHSEESAARPTEALHALRTARAAEHRHHRAATRARRTLTTEFTPTRDPDRATALLRAAVRPPTPAVSLPTQSRGPHLPDTPRSGAPRQPGSPHPDSTKPGDFAWQADSPSPDSGWHVDSRRHPDSTKPGDSARHADSPRHPDSGWHGDSPPHGNSLRDGDSARHGDPSHPMPSHGSAWLPRTHPVRSDAAREGSGRSDRSDVAQPAVPVQAGGSAEVVAGGWNHGESGSPPRSEPGMGPSAGGHSVGPPFTDDAVAGHDQRGPRADSAPAVAGRDDRSGLFGAEGGRRRASETGVAGEESSRVGRHEAAESDASADTPDVRADPGFTLILVRVEPIGHPDAVDPEEPVLPVGDDALINALASRVRGLAPTGTDLVRSDRGEFAVLLPRTPTAIAEQFAGIIRRQATRGAGLADTGGRPMTVRTAVANHAAAGVPRGLDSLLEVARTTLRGESAPPSTAAGRRRRSDPDEAPHPAAPNAADSLPTAPNAANHPHPAALPASNPHPAAGFDEVPSRPDGRQPDAAAPRQAAEQPLADAVPPGTGVGRSRASAEKPLPDVVPPRAVTRRSQAAVDHAQVDVPGSGAAVGRSPVAAARPQPAGTGPSPADPAQVDPAQVDPAQADPVQADSGQPRPESGIPTASPGGEPQSGTGSSLHQRPSRRERRAAEEAPPDAYEVLSRFGITAAGGGRRRAPDDDLDPYLTVGAASPRAMSPIGPGEVPPVEPGPDRPPAQPDSGTFPPVPREPRQASPGTTASPVVPEPDEVPPVEPAPDPIPPVEPAPDPIPPVEPAPDPVPPVEPAPDEVPPIGPSPDEVPPGEPGAGERSSAGAAELPTAAALLDRLSKLVSEPDPPTAQPEEARRTDSAVLPRPTAAMAEWLRRAGRPLPEDDVTEDTPVAEPGQAAVLPQAEPEAVGPRRPGSRRDRSSSGLADLLAEALAAYQESQPGESWSDDVADDRSVTGPPDGKQASAGLPHADVIRAETPVPAGLPPTTGTPRQAEQPQGGQADEPHGRQAEHPHGGQADEPQAGGWTDARPANRAGAGGRRRAADASRDEHLSADSRAQPEDAPSRRSPLDAALSGRRSIAEPVEAREGGRRRAAEDGPGFDLANLGWRGGEESQAPGRRAARRAREESGPRDWAADARAADPQDSPPPGRGWTWGGEPGGRHRSSGWAPADVDGA